MPVAVRSSSSRRAEPYRRFPESAPPSAGSAELAVSCAAARPAGERYGPPIRAAGARSLCANRSAADAHGPSVARDEAEEWPRGFRGVMATLPRRADHSSLSGRIDRPQGRWAMAAGEREIVARAGTNRPDRRTGSIRNRGRPGGNPHRIHGAFFPGFRRTRAEP